MNRMQNERVRVTPIDARIFVFGDSLSDTGNIFRGTGGQIPPSPPYFNGRFSNGPVAVETLGARLGLVVSPITNFAVGGSTTGRANIGDTPALRIGGLLDQIDRFVATRGPRRANPDALYFIWIGGDDFLGQPTATGADISQAVENVRTAVTTLASQGARNIVVVQNPNLGRTPISLQTGLLGPLTSVTREFNSQLQSTLTRLERNSNLNLVLSDLFPVGEAIAQTPAEFGFSNVTDSYLRGVLPADPLADPNQFFFWDLLHPTTRGHDVFANRFRQDVINGIADNITRIGTPRDNRLVTYAGNDRLIGLGGQDILQSNRGRDTLLGGGGNDLLQGLQNSDLLAGESGNDSLRGGTGLDALFGQAGRDTLIGGNGIDFLSGGDGDDLLSGGGGCDLFSLRPRPGIDRIRDFDTNGDLLLTPNQVGFSDLEIQQRGRNTVISLAGAGPLAILENVQASSISSSDFIGQRIRGIALDFANREQGAIILDAIQAELAGAAELKDLLNMRRG